jgi:hypothetical protein
MGLFGFKPYDFTPPYKQHEGKLVISSYNDKKFKETFGVDKIYLVKLTNQNKNSVAYLGVRFTVEHAKYGNPAHSEYEVRDMWFPKSKAVGSGSKNWYKITPLTSSDKKEILRVIFNNS